MNFLVPIALFGWVPAVLALFALLPPRRAVIAATLIAWLFLPMAGLPIPGLPDWTKMTATSVGCVLGCFFFDQARLFSFRMRWFDWPMLIWCIVPFFASITNDLGVYDGISTSIAQVFIWGLPYLIGRVYFSDLEGLRELAIGMFVGGLVYVPLCLIEIKMSPQLHNWVYGYHPHKDFAQTLRWGGYRPTVFMQHGLMVAMWMTAASLIGIWLWRSRTLNELWGVPMFFLVPIQVITTILCKSMNAVALGMLGVGALYSIGILRSRIVLIALMIAGPTYIGLRLFDIWGGEELAQMVSRINPERGASLQARLNAESLLARKALQQPIFGWGGWGRARVRAEDGRDLATTDGLWIITVGNQGIVGLASWMLVLLLPAMLLTRYHRPDDWSHPAFAPAGVLAVLLVLYLLDCVMNAMVNPVFTMAAGGVTGLQGLRIAARAYPQHPAPRVAPNAPPSGPSLPAPSAPPSSRPALAYRAGPSTSE